jgi:hypothetical protein
MCMCVCALVGPALPTSVHTYVRRASTPPVVERSHQLSTSIPTTTSHYPKAAPDNPVAGCAPCPAESYPAAALYVHDRCVRAVRPPPRERAAIQIVVTYAHTDMYVRPRIAGPREPLHAASHAAPTTTSSSTPSCICACLSPCARPALRRDGGSGLRGTLYLPTLARIDARTCICMYIQSILSAHTYMLAG